MDDAQQLHMRVALQFFLDYVGVDGGAEGELKGVDIGTATTGDVGHAASEEAVDGDHGGVTSLQDVAEGGFHASGAGGGEGKGHFVGCAEEAAEHVVHGVHALEEDGVEMSQHGLGHGLEDPGVDAAGTGA